MQFVIYTITLHPQWVIVGGLSCWTNCHFSSLKKTEWESETSDLVSRNCYIVSYLEKPKLKES